MARFSLVHGVAVILCCLGMTGVLGAGEPAQVAKDASVASEATAQSRAVELAKKREAISEQIKAASPGASGEAAEKKRDDLLSVLRSTDATYAQEQAQLEQRRSLEAQVKKAEQDLETLDKFAPDEPKPYSFLLLETLRDQLDVAEEHHKTLKADGKAAEQSLKAAHEELDAAEKDRQKLAARNGADKPSDELARAEAVVTLARAKVALRQNEIEIDNLRVALSKATQEQLQAKIKVVEEDAKFSAGDRDAQVARLEKSIAELRQQRRETEMRWQQLEADKKAALDELSENKAPENVVNAANEAWHVASDVYQGEVAVLDQAIENRGTIRRIWTRRYDVANDSADVQKLPQWLDDLDEFRDQLDDFASSVEHRRDGTGATASTAAAPLAATPAKDTNEEGTAKWRELRQAKLRELRDVCDARLEDIHATQRMLDRFRGELKARIKKTGSIWGTTAGQTLNSLLSYEIAGDEDSPVTVGRLLELLLYVAIGIAIAYALTHVIARRLLPRLGLHHGTVSAVRSILFYALCVGSAVAAFQLLQIPAEAFAFVGGAVAIAAGFGGQDIMNNFMSGIILLVERPIRAGDVVQLEGVQGVVLHIGLRSTRLQTDANHELIVPNKTLIDEQVTNLTLSDNFVQRFVVATLERDVPIDEAKRKMLEVVFRHPLVLKSPRPVVLLKEVETYWLTFEIHFWLEHGNFIKCALVDSEILEVIGDMYRPPKEDSEGKEANAAAESEGQLDEAATPSAATSASATMPAGSSQILGDMKKMSRAVLSKELKRGSVRMKA